MVTSPKQVLKASAAGRILLWSDRSLFAVSRFGSTAPTILFLPAQVSFGAMRQSRRFSYCPAALLYDSRTYETGANIAAARMIAAMSKEMAGQIKQPPLNGDRLPYQVILARVIRPARDDDVLPAFRGQCLFATVLPTQRTVHSADKSYRTAPE